MNITITIPDGDENRIIGKVARYYGWTQNSSFTKREFIKQLLIGYLKADLEKAERQEVIDATPSQADIAIT